MANEDEVNYPADTDDDDDEIDYDEDSAVEEETGVKPSELKKYEKIFDDAHQNG